MDDSTKELSRRSADICARLDSALALIDEIKNSADATEFFEQMKSTKHLLEAINASHEMMCKYAEIEASAYVAFARKRNRPSTFTLRQSHVYDWLRELSYGDQEKVIEQARKGSPIENQYDNSRRFKMREQQYEDAAAYRDSALEKLKANGYVKISVDECVSTMRYAGNEKARSIADAFVDRTKDDILRNGGVGLGNGEYISVNHEKFEAFAYRAVCIRIKSIIRDLISLRQITNRLNDPPVLGTCDVSMVDERNNNADVIKSVLTLLDVLGIAVSKAGLPKSVLTQNKGSAA